MLSQPRMQLHARTGLAPSAARLRLRNPAWRVACMDSGNSAPKMQPAAGNSNDQTGEARPVAESPQSLDLAFESAGAAAMAAAAAAPSPLKSMSQHGSPVKTTGLRRAPLSGGVKTATQRFDLPKPPVAVRNLVEQAQFAHLCTVMSHMHHR